MADGDEKHLIVQLLQELKALAESTEHKVDLLYTSRLQRDTEAQQQQAQRDAEEMRKQAKRDKEARQLAEQERQLIMETKRILREQEAIKQQKAKEDAEKKKNEKEQADLDLARAHGAWLPE